MRGVDKHAGLKFSETRMPKHESPVVPGYLYRYPLKISFAAADEYEARNDRLIRDVAGVAISTNTVQHKAPYKHLARYWGIVPESSIERVEKQKRIERAREGVKTQC